MEFCGTTQYNEVPGKELAKCVCYIGVLFRTLQCFQKISKPTPWMVTGNSEGKVVSKAKIVKGK